MSKFFLTIIIFLTCLHSNGQKSSLRWGLSGEKNKMVVDETEILVIEWLEYVFYNDLSQFKTYTQKYNCTEKKLTESEKITLLNNKIIPATKPDSTLLKLVPYGFLFNDSPDKI